MLISNRFKNDEKPSLRLSKKQKEKIKEWKIIKKKRNKIKCIICNHAKFERISEKDRYGFFYPVDICKTCGLIMSNPQLTKKAYTLFYDKFYSTIYRDNSDHNLVFENQYLKGKQIYSFLKNHLKLKLENLKIYEVGASSGGCLKFFKDKKNKVGGCDLSSEYVRVAKSKKIKLVQSRLNEKLLPFYPDLIIYSHVLEHLINPLEDLQKIFTFKIQPKWIYIEVPGVYNVNYMSGNFLKTLQNAHTYYFTLKSLDNLLLKAGYKRVYGNENIQAIYAPITNKLKIIIKKEDYAETKKFLKKMENLRFVYKIKKLPSKIMKKLFAKIQT